MDKHYLKLHKTTKLNIKKQKSGVYKTNGCMTNVPKRKVGVRLKPRKFNE